MRDVRCSRRLPRGFGGQRPDPEDVKKSGWHETGILVVSINDERLDWPEKAFLEIIGNRLYGERATHD